MFKSPFTFEGRIRRIEYGLSYLIYLFLYAITAFVWYEFPKASLLFYLFYAVLIWFMLAQGAKRCHDLNNSGFYQFIPFYGLWMLFQDGIKEDNKYGKNPKENEQNSPIQIEVNQYSTDYLELVVQLSSFFLLNTMVAALIIEYAPVSEIWLFFCVMISIIPCYFLALFLNSEHAQDDRIQLKKRIIYSCLFYICIRMYAVYFEGAEIQIQTIYFELLVVGFILAITYFPLLLHKAIFKNKLSQNEI